MCKGFTQWAFVPLVPTLFINIKVLHKKLKGIHPMGLCDTWANTISYSQSTPQVLKSLSKNLDGCSIVSNTVCLITCDKYHLVLTLFP